MGTANINIAQPLRLLIARERGLKSEAELRKAFTASFFGTLMFLPLYISAGIVIVWISPNITGVSSQYFTVVRIASAFLVIAFIIKQIYSLFESVLRGMNLAYKRMGIRASIIIIGGILTGVLLYLGYGIPGMAFAQIIIVALTGATFWWIVKVNVPWFGLEKINIKEIITFIKLSGWFMAVRLIRLADSSSDILLLGILAGPEFVSTYVISKFLMNAATGSVNQIIIATTPGFGKLIGEKKYGKLLLARQQMINLIWIFTASTGAVICLWNNAFISIWTKPKYFAGQNETFLIVAVATLTALFQVDSSLINLTLNLKRKIILTTIAVVTTITLAIILIPIYNIAGLLIAILIGKIMMNVGYARVLTNLLEVKLTQLALVSRTSFICILTLINYWILGEICNC